MEITAVLGSLGNLFSAFFFVSPVCPTFWTIWKTTRSTEGLSYVQYVCTLLNTTLWTYYGCISGQAFIYGINGFGVLAQVIFVGTFILFGPKRLITSVVVVVVNVVIPIIAIIAAGAEWLGWVCVLLTIIMYVSPLAPVITNSVIDMPVIWFLVCSSLNATTWGLYGFLKRDYAVLVANGVGVVTSLVQLVIYACKKYTRNEEEHPPPPQIPENEEEDPTLEEPLIS